MKSYTLGAWLLAISTAIAAILGFGFLMYIVGNLSEVFAADNPLGPFAAMLFVVPFVALTVVNALLLRGALHKNTAALIVATLILPIEWIVGFVLGGNAISSGLFNGKQYLSAFPHHHELQVLVFILFAGLSFYAYGKELRAVHTRQKTEK